MRPAGGSRHRPSPTKLHQMLVRGRAGRLHGTRRGHGHFIFDTDLAIAEAAYDNAAEQRGQMPRDRLRQRQFALPVNGHRGMIHAILLIRRHARRFNWLGWKDSNLRMTESKSVALPWRHPTKPHRCRGSHAPPPDARAAVAAESRTKPIFAGKATSAVRARHDRVRGEHATARTGQPCLTPLAEPSQRRRHQDISGDVR